MKRFLVGLGILVVLLIIAIIALPFIIPAQVVKDQVAAQVKAATGRDLVITGDVKPTVFPTLGVEVGGVSFANADWAQEPQMVTAKEMIAKLSLLPLISGKVEVKGFRLVEPVIHLEIGPTGQVNWDFGDLAARVESTAAETQSSPAVSSGDESARTLNDIRLDNVEIVDGTVTFADSITNERHNAEDINIELSLPGLDSTLTAKGSMRLDGEPVEVGITADTLRSLMENQAGNIDISFRSTPATFAYKGSIDSSGQVPQINGVLEANLPDMKSPSFEPILQRLQGLLPPEFDSLKSANLSGPFQISSTGAKTDLIGQIVYREQPVNLTLKLDGEGDVAGGAPVNVDLTLSGKPLQFSFKGVAAGGSVPTAKGDYAIAIPAPFEAANWALGSAQAALKDVGAVKVAGKVDLGADTYSLGAKGNVSYKGEAISLDAKGSGAGRPEQPGTTKLSLAANAAHFDVSFDGSALRRATDTDDKPMFEVSGPFSFKSASIPALAAWAGAELGPSGDVLGAADIQANLFLIPKWVRLDQMTVNLGDTSATGRFGLGLTDPLRIRGDLEVSALDLNRYLPKGTDGDNVPGATAGAAKPASSGWSRAPIDVSGLRGIDVNLKVAVNNLLYEKLKLDRAAMKIVLSDGALALDLNELRLYGGSGNGTVRMSPTGSGLTTSNSFTFNGLQVRPFLRDAAGFDRVAGNGNIRINVQSSGASQHDIMNALNGDGSILFSDGAIYGVNIPAFTRKAATLWADNTAGEEQKTDFAELSASFVINNGVLRNDDMKLVGPLIRVNGAGNVDIGAQTLNYRVTPSAVGSLEGQGSEIMPAGLTLFPIDIVGPWSSPSFRPDLGGAIENALKDPSALIEGAKGLLKGDGLKNVEDAAKALLEGDGGGGGVEGILKGVLGGGNGGTTESGTEGLVKGLLGNRSSTNDSQTTEDTGGGLVKGLLGGGTTSEPAPEPEPEATEPQPALPDAGKLLKGLFGD